MTIEKHRNKWRIRETVHGVRYSLYVDEKPSKKEAQRMIHNHIEKQDISVKTVDDFESACEKYFSIKSNVLSPSTLVAYRSMKESLPENFKRLKLRQLNNEHVQIMINELAAKLSPKTVRNYHGFISAVLGVYKPNLKLHTTLPEKTKYEANTPSEHAIESILEKVKGTRYEIPYRLGCYGLRRSEILALTSDDLAGNYLTINKGKVQADKNEYTIKNTPKTYESIRKIYIDDTLAEMIREKDGPLFTGHPNRLNDHLREIQRREGIPREKWFRFHDFRAYYASMAHAMGVPDKYIQKNGGWKSDHVMKRVYQRTIDDIEKEMNQLYASKFNKDF